MNMTEAARTLAIISQAWGSDDNEGYCFFPWIEAKGDERKFQTKSFYWPTDRLEILDHMVAHVDDDLYWCPMLFSEDNRRTEVAKEEYCLWADLDEADPRNIEKRWRPSVAWQTSPGRYQALWLLEDPEEEDLYGASQKGADNQRMTRMVDADPSGWDTTQLLRLPGWTNHKSQYEVDGEFPKGRLLWGGKKKGPYYRASDFNDLPAIPKEEEVEIDPDLFDTIEGVESERVLSRIRHELPPAALKRLERGPQEGEDRSRPMFYFMRCLADVGCSIAEIAAVIRPTLWNKFKGRTDELEQLSNQAKEAWKKRKKSALTEITHHTVKNVNDFLANIQQPTWLVRDMIVKGSVGFIGGEPKARKSWVALDLALSIAACSSGLDVRFLDKFLIGEPGPVLYVILEDGDYLVGDRIRQVWEDKTRYDGTRFSFDPTTGQVFTEQKTSRIEAHLNIIYGEPVNFSNAASMARIHRVIREGYKLSNGKTKPYSLVIFDTLMRSVGGSDINNMGEMMNIILDPLSRLAKDKKTNILMVHHFNKGKVEGEVRGGTRLLGSQALHAWAEDSLYLTAREHGFVIELESKLAPTGRWEFATDPTQRTWSPRHTFDVSTHVHEPAFAEVAAPKPRPADPKALTALRSLDRGPHTTKELSALLDWTTSATHRALTKLADQNRVAKVGTSWQLP